ncbi:MAG: LysR family transcriptional regulator [Casimicrobiaceae bacterium]
MKVTLSQLKAFERIVRLGSFHAAARELGLTQPSVSQRIRELEAALNTPLFVRRGPRVSLTAEGHALVEYADRMLGTAGELVERFRTRDPLKGMLRLGLNESFALICLPDLLHRLEQRYPAIRTSVFVGDTGLVSQLLNKRELDIAVVSEPDVGAHVKLEPIGRNTLGWYARADIKLARGVHSPADLCQFHLVVSPPSAQLHATAGRWFAQAGVAPQRVSTCNSLSATILTIRQGTAVGLVPVRVMQDEVERHSVRRIRVAPELPAHRVSICYQISEFGPGLKVLVDLTRELVAQHKLFV